MDDNFVIIQRPRLICECKNVSLQKIQEEVHVHGTRTLKDLILRTRASTGCGSCASAVREAFETELAKVAPESPESADNNS